MEKNILEQIFDSKINRIDNIERFNGNNFFGKRESVSQHSFWVAYYANFLVEEIVPLHNFKLKYITVQTALNHDIDESIIWNDITYPLKYHKVYGKGFKYLLNSIINYELENDVDIFYQFYKNSLNSTSITQEKNFIKNLVKVCDWLSFFKISFYQFSCGNLDFKNLLKIGIDNFITCLSDLDAKITICNDQDSDLHLNNTDIIKKILNSLNKLKSI